MDVSPAVEVAPKVPRKRWYRRWRVWLVAPVLLVLILGAGLRVFVFHHSQSQLAVLTKLEGNGFIDIVETPRTQRFLTVIETLDKIPGFSDWILSPLAEQMGESPNLVLAAADWMVGFPQSERGPVLTPEEFRALTTLRNVLGINFSNQPLSKEQIESLAGMTWLTSLAIDLSSFQEEAEVRSTRFKN
ncbi:MAG: hypothetical protein U0903_18945 [Planctomycetales bacterium]